MKHSFLHTQTHSLFSLACSSLTRLPLPLPSPHFLCVFRWPFGRRASKSHDPPPFRQADTYTYSNPVGTLTFPSPLCVNEDPPHILLHTPQHTHTHKNTPAKREEGGVLVTTRTQASLDPPPEKTLTHHTRHTHRLNLPPPPLSHTHMHHTRHGGGGCQNDARPCPLSPCIPPPLLELEEEAEWGEGVGGGGSDGDDLSWLVDQGKV